MSPVNRLSESGTITCVSFLLHLSFVIGPESVDVVEINMLQVIADGNEP